ncbi:MAG TPA: hypothetical protein PLE48_13460 [Thiobacillus sp.]|nr:hypothetical protein [Thiobacillus sp.]
MLEEMTNPDLIEFVIENPDSSDEALELAHRLQYAVDELDRMSAMLSKLEVHRGADT